MYSEMYGETVHHLRFSSQHVNELVLEWLKPLLDIALPPPRHPLNTSTDAFRLLFIADFSAMEIFLVLAVYLVQVGQ